MKTKAEEFRENLDEWYPKKGGNHRAYETLMRYEVRYELEEAYQQGLLAGREEGHAAGRLAGLEEAVDLIAKEHPDLSGIHRLTDVGRFADTILNQIKAKAQQIREGKG